MDINTKWMYVALWKTAWLAATRPWVPYSARAHKLRVTHKEELTSASLACVKQPVQSSVTQTKLGGTRLESQHSGGRDRRVPAGLRTGWSTS